MKNTIKITLNGVKAKDLYIPCRFSLTENETVYIYAKEYGDHLPQELGNVINETDSLTDYFEKDRVEIKKDSQFYSACYRAAINELIKRWKMTIKDREKDMKRMPYYAESYQKEIAEAQIQLANWQAIFDRIA